MFCDDVDIVDSSSIVEYLNVTIKNFCLVTYRGPKLVLVNIFHHTPSLFLSLSNLISFRCFQALLGVGIITKSCLNSTNTIACVYIGFHSKLFSRTFSCCSSSASSSPGSENKEFSDRYKRRREENGVRKESKNKTTEKQDDERKLPRITIHDRGCYCDSRGQEEGEDSLNSVSTNRISSKKHDSGSGKNLNEFNFIRNKNPYLEEESNIKQVTLSNSSRRLLEANEEHERELWRAARNYHQLEHYDYSLFGLDPNLDQAVGLHQREAMLYNQGEF